MTYTEMIVRLLVAAVLGGLLGWDRERRGPGAGLRTHILVSTGAALIMLTAFHAREQAGASGLQVDVGRIIAGVVTGIGFLGGGTIIKTSERARGLTTAASIWVTAGIGLTVGIGFYPAAIAATVIALVTLIAVRWVEQHWL